MAATLLQPGTSAPKPGASAPSDPLAGMTLLTAEGQQPRAKAAVEITKSALKRIRIAMAKEGISPTAGGLRVGITGGGCSGLSYNIRFDTQPRERDRTFIFGAGIETPNDPSGAKPVRLFVDPKSFLNEDTKAAQFGRLCRSEDDLFRLKSLSRSRSVWSCWG